jgi:hypothetical protein
VAGINEGEGMKTIKTATVHMRDYQLEFTDLSLDDINWLRQALNQLEQHILSGEEE